MPSPAYGRGLARAGWSVVRPATAPAEVNSGPSPELDALGAQLVSQVAASWTSRYQFTIKSNGFDGQCAFHYECIFSCPTNETPVPSFVFSTRFALVVPSVGADPKLFYSFEEGDLRHEWALSRDGYGQLTASSGQQFSSLGDLKFESYMDRVVHEKEQVRNRGVDLRTCFEETRLEKPPAYSEASSNSDESGSEAYADSQGHDVADVAAVEKLLDAADDLDPEADHSNAVVMREALQAAGLYCDKVDPPSSLAELLASIFDAADEENVGELPHYEVARLLSATLPGFGLELWDIHLLMTSAQENDDGFIECKPFIQAAPEIIQALRKRRMVYRGRGLPGVEVPAEAVKHCFTDEVTGTANQLMKVFEQMTQEDPTCGRWAPKHKEEHGTHHPSHQPGKPHGRSGSTNADPGVRGSFVAPTNGQAAPHIHGMLGEMADEMQLAGIKRRFCQDCIASLPERLSPQETMRLMQMLPEDEEGYIMIEELVDYLEHLRTDAMLNALVESDVLSLRTHLVLRFRRLGLAEDGKLNLWVIKEALLQADQVCLTRLQIHVLLCLAIPDSFGLVNIAEFLGMCCVVIPHMFDARLFVETAERLVLEHAENMRQAENAEMAALGAARSTTIGGEGEEAQEKVDVDPETVERTLQQVLTLNDDLHRNPPSLPPEQIFTILGVNEKEIQSTQLSTFEITGFMAEMQPDADGFVAYVEHIKKWVPIIFEQRKNRLLGRYLEVGCYETLSLEPPDLQKLEQVFPLLPYNTNVGKPKGSQRRSSRLRERRDSFGQQYNSFSSHPPSHSKNSKSLTGEEEYSKGGSPINRRASHLSKQGSLHLRRSSVNIGGVGSKRREGSHPVEVKAKEPPPGRGFLRRKARMAADEAAKAEEEAPMHHVKSNRPATHHGAAHQAHGHHGHKTEPAAH